MKRRSAARRESAPPSTWSAQSPPPGGEVGARGRQERAADVDQWRPSAPAGVAGADKAAVGREQGRAAASEEVDAVAVEVRAGYVAAAAGANLVGAFEAAAAPPPVDEGVVPVAAAVDRDGFDLLFVGDRID